MVTPPNRGVVDVTIATVNNGIDAVVSYIESHGVAIGIMVAIVWFIKAQYKQYSLGHRLTNEPGSSRPFSREEEIHPIRMRQQELANQRAKEAAELRQRKQSVSSSSGTERRYDALGHSFTLGYAGSYCDEKLRMRGQWWNTSFVSLCFFALLHCSLTVAFRCRTTEMSNRNRRVINNFFGSLVEISASSQRTTMNLRSSFSSIKDDQKDMHSAAKVTILPLVVASGYSQAVDMKVAINEAVEMALEALPPLVDGTLQQIDLAQVSVSSLYDGSVSPATVVPTMLEAASTYGKGIQHLVGCTCGGFISSRAVLQSASNNNKQGKEDFDGNDFDDDDAQLKDIRACVPVELEGVPGVSVVLCVLPDVNLETFHVEGEDVPDDYGRMSNEQWKRSIGLSVGIGNSDDQHRNDPQAILLLPSPAFSHDLDGLLRGFGMHIPECSLFGAVASTVSTLSRARLFRHDVSACENGSVTQTLATGCVGVIMSGDIHVQTMVAQGAKPVGGVYRILKGQDSTISTIVLDEAATELLRQDEMAEGEQDEAKGEENSSSDDKASQMTAAYAKARIPKPVLAEANFLMKTLSDDDQAFMRKALLVGLERGGGLGRSPSELARLAEGKGHIFTVHQVAGAAMKDGSITLSLGSVNIEQGTRMRFFVRESAFAKREVEALWMGYKKRSLLANIQGKPQSFTPSGCFLFPTLDRGSKFFQGKSCFETSAVSQFLPTVPSIYGFFSNGVIGVLDSDEKRNSSEGATLQGSASSYVLIGSKTHRPVFSATQKQSLLTETDNTKKWSIMKSSDMDDRPRSKAPRDQNGELILKRREVHSGRALTVSTVEWSVAEKKALPSSKLEGFMWEKETEVDRFRERVPLANLISQCKQSSLDPTEPIPRDWIGSVRDYIQDGRFVIIPECKRSEPGGGGSLRKRYDLRELIKELMSFDIPAISVNCDGVLFGGSLDDLTQARDSGAPPILASDLILYPYQLYKMRLAGADAVNLLVGALATKDLVYLTKIAKGLQMQSLMTVTSTTQLERVVKFVAPGEVDGLIVSNRELEDFSFDMTGQQALTILRSDAMNAYLEAHSDALVLAEGRVGIIHGKSSDGMGKSAIGYIQQLKDAGAQGAIVGGGLAPDTNNRGTALLSLDATL